jgi:NADH pyrophosphatase NudC (nudix superfamily)
MQNIKAFTYKIIYPLARIYWFFKRPITSGVRCIIRYDDEVLLVRHTYGNYSWTGVGGGIETGETQENAVCREAKEEVGITLTNVTYITSIPHTAEYKKDTINVYSAVVETKELTIDRSEIAEACWFKLKNLPHDTSPLYLEFLKHANITHSLT